MAAPPPNLGILPTPATVTYRERFSDASYDVFNGDYAAIMDQYKLDLQPVNAPTPASLATSACNARANGTVTPTAYLLMHGGMIHLYHSISRFLPRLGQLPTEWDDLMFVTKGDLYQNMPTTTFWLSDYFRQIPNQLRVATSATIEAALAADPNLQILGPYNAQDAGTTLIRCRRSIYLPPKYVPLMITGPVTPRLAWEMLRGQIVIDGIEEDCKPLIQWLQLALTGQVNDPNLSVLDTVHPTAPVADATLMEHRRRILIQDFPALGEPARANQQNLIAEKVGLLTTVIQQENVAAARRREEDSAKTIATLVGETGVQQLLRLCQVGTEAALPQIWSSLSNAPKQQHLSLVQWAVDQAKVDLECTQLPFIITPALLAKIKSLKFAMTSMHDHKSGIQPFILGEVHEDTAALTVEMWTTIQGDQASPSLLDLRSLLAASDQIPKILLHTRESVRRMHALMFVLLGPTHTIVNSLNSFVQEFIARESMLVNYVPNNVGGAALLPTLLSKYVAVRLSNWFKKQCLQPAATPSPEFVDVFDKMELGEAWEPPLLPVLIQQILPRPVWQPSSALAPAPHVSPAPAPAPSENPSNPGARRQGRVNNPDFCTRLFEQFRSMAGLTVRQIKERAQREGHTLPPSKVDPSKSMCLAYHAKGICNEGCGVACDHVRYTDAEYSDLHAWCTQHYHA